MVSSPTNFGFGSGLTGWTLTGNNHYKATTPSGGIEGNYLHIANGAASGPQVVSSAFTVTAGGTRLAFWIRTSATARIQAAVGPNYNTWTDVDAVNTGGNWVKQSASLSAYVGQSIKLRYFSVGTADFDEGAWRDIAPGWTPSDEMVWQPAVTIPATTGTLGDATGCKGASVPAVSGPVVTIGSNDTMTSAPFTFPGDATRMSFWVTGSGSGLAATISVTMLDESPQVLRNLFFNSFTSGQAIHTYCDVSAYAGRPAKITIRASTGNLTTLAGGEALSFFGSSALDPRGDPVSMATGANKYSHTDIAIPGKGIPLEFTRTYLSSSLTNQGSLGWGWTHNYSAKLIILTDGSAILQNANGSRAFFTNSAGTLIAPQGVFATLVKNMNNTYTLTSTDKSKLEFDTTGKLAGMTDRNSNTTTLAYDGSGFLATATAPGGRQLTFTVDGSGRITQISDPLSRTVGYTYDANGDLTKITDVKAGETDYTYSNHLLLTLTDSLGNLQNTNIYDAASRVVEQEDAINGYHCFYYGHGPVYTSANCPGVTPSPVAGQTIMVDPRGNKSTHQFDTSFRPTAVIDALGNETVYTYEATGALCSPANKGNLCSVTDPLNHTTSFTYNSSGNTLTTTNADNMTWTYTYNSFNDVLTSTDPLTRVTTNVYNGSGNLTSTTNALSQTTTYTPNTDGTLASVSDPLSHATTFAYDTHGNLTSSTDALSHATTHTYDAGGRVLTSTDALSHAATFTYDNQNNVLTAKDALNNTTTNTYDAKGQRLTVNDANNKTTSFAYDDAGRVTTVTDPLSQTVTSAYDANGNRTSMTNPRGKVTTYTYDALNRLTNSEDPLSRDTAYTYDAASRRITRTDAKSQLTTYSYDVVDRLTLIDYPTGTTDTSFTYDALGNRLTMVDGTGTTTYTLDALYRRTGITDGASIAVGYGYDAAGRMTTLTYPGGVETVTYGYDNANRLTSVTDWQSKVTSYTYDNADRLTSTTLGNGLISDRTYDNANRLLTVLNRNGGATISSYTYTVDAVGNRSQMVDTIGTSTYTYDNLYRLTGVTYPNADVQSYTFDAQGNRLTKVHNAATTNYSYDDADQMTSAGGVTYTYDNNGNQTAAGSDTFTWDAETRLTGTTIGGGTTGTYAFNGDGLRTSRTIGGVTSTFVWDQNAGLPQILKDSAGNRFVYGLDLISRTDSGGTQEYYLTDGLGSTTGLATGAGTVTDTYTYDVYGAVRSRTGTSGNEFTFTGEQTDASGLQYLRARSYDPATGRFVALDPLPLMQRYAYAGGNPANYVDPTGLDSEEPEPIPLPPPGVTSEDLEESCQQGFQRCVDETASDEAAAVRNLTNDERKQAYMVFVGMCVHVLRNCRDRAVLGDPRTEFDFEDAKEKMRGVYRSASSGPRVPSWIDFPNLGSGGYRTPSTRNSKEGMGACAW